MSYKLYYFNYAARAEQIRWLLIYGKIEFEDIRYEEYEEWPKVKSTMQFCQLPVLEIDGRKFHESKAILRFLAKKVGLNGENELEDLEIDGIVDTIDEFMLKIVPTAWLTDEPLKSNQMSKIKSEVVPFYLQKLNALAEVNGGFLACGKLTYADFVIASYEEYLNWILKDEFKVFEKYKNLNILCEKVLALPAVEKWIKERPKSMYLLRNEII